MEYTGIHSEFVALAKSRPGQLNYGSSGPGATDHLAGELFNALTGANMVHVPYKGGAPAMLDLIGGNVQLVFSTVSTAVGSMKAGKIRPLAMTGNQRFALMPEIPTMSEAGLKGFEVNSWYGLFVPAGTPKDVIARLHDETAKALAASDVKHRLLESGIVTTTSSPEQFMRTSRRKRASGRKSFTTRTSSSIEGAARPAHQPAERAYAFVTHCAAASSLRS